MRVRLIICLPLCLGLILCCSAQAYRFKGPVGVPTRSGAESFTLLRVQRVAPGAYASSPHDFSVPIVRVPGDTPAQAAARKANAIAAAINGANLPGVTASVGAPLPGSIFPQLTVSNCGGLLVPQGGDGTREGIGGGGVSDDNDDTPGAGSSQGSMGSGANPGSGTGIDGDAAQSDVSFGLGDNYVSHLTPFIGETEPQILSRLAGDLSAHSIPTVFGADGALRLAQPLASGQSVIWGNTDAGFDFTYGLQLSIPEPASLGILALGAAVICARHRR